MIAECICKKRVFDGRFTFKKGKNTNLALVDLTDATKFGMVKQ